MRLHHVLVPRHEHERQVAVDEEVHRLLQRAAVRHRLWRVLGPSVEGLHEAAAHHVVEDLHHLAPHFRRVGGEVAPLVQRRRRHAHQHLVQEVAHQPLLLRLVLRPLAPLHERPGGDGHLPALRRQHHLCAHLLGGGHVLHPARQGARHLRLHEEPQRGPQLLGGLPNLHKHGERLGHLAVDPPSHGVLNACLRGQPLPHHLAPVRERPRRLAQQHAMQHAPHAGFAVHQFRHVLSPHAQRLALGAVHHKGHGML
mmetsp:Transcript_16553/g.40517  ORF Transcript_16553/g.40517 Transcript_16553/m.40517 type:complete len:255 (-) Transcript_16553:2610-3374(-)